MQLKPLRKLLEVLRQVMLALIIVTIGQLLDGFAVHFNGCKRGEAAASFAASRKKHADFVLTSVLPPQVTPLRSGRHKHILRILWVYVQVFQRHITHDQQHQ